MVYLDSLFTVKPDEGISQNQRLSPLDILGLAQSVSLMLKHLFCMKSDVNLYLEQEIFKCKAHIVLEITVLDSTS